MIGKEAGAGYETQNLIAQKGGIGPNAGGDVLGTMPWSYREELERVTMSGQTRTVQGSVRRVYSWFPTPTIAKASAGPILPLISGVSTFYERPIHPRCRVLRGSVASMLNISTQQKYRHSEL